MTDTFPIIPRNVRPLWIIVLILGILVAAGALLIRRAQYARHGGKR